MDKRGRYVVSAIIIPLNNPLPVIFESSTVGRCKEIESVHYCNYRDMFNPAYIEDVVEFVRKEDVLRMNPNITFGPNWHLRNFRKRFTNLHKILMIDNPKVVSIMEVPNKRNIKHYPSIDLGIPGGKLEYVDHYDPDAAIVREVKEETCLDVNVDFDYQYDLRKKYGLNYEYEARYYDGNITFITYIIIY